MRWGCWVIRYFAVIKGRGGMEFFVCVGWRFCARRYVCFLFRGIFASVLIRRKFRLCLGRVVRLFLRWLNEFLCLFGFVSVSFRYCYL